MPTITHTVTAPFLDGTAGIILSYEGEESPEPESRINELPQGPISIFVSSVLKGRFIAGSVSALVPTFSFSSNAAMQMEGGKSYRVNARDINGTGVDLLSSFVTLSGVVSPGSLRFQVVCRVAGFTARQGIVPNPASYDRELTITGTSGVNLTWFQARFLALAGAKIRRAGWQDRYLIYRDSLWWMQLYNAITKADTTIAPVVSSQWSPEDFRASDWLPHGVVDPALITEAGKILTRF